jgi:multicomponent Na+:H+ antiporter subunit C
MILEAFILLTIFCGFFGVIFKKNLIMKTVSMDIMSTGIIAYYVIIASKDGFFTPILSTGEISYADPVPQSVILTAIVIGFSTLALMLVTIIKLSKNNPTLETKEIEKNNS